MGVQYKALNMLVRSKQYEREVFLGNIHSRAQTIGNNDVISVLSFFKSLKKDLFSFVIYFSNLTNLQFSRNRKHFFIYGFKQLRTKNETTKSQIIFLFKGISNSNFRFPISLKPDGANFLYLNRVQTGLNYETKFKHGCFSRKLGFET